MGMSDDPAFATARDAANDSRILLFGRLLGAANHLEYLLARDLDEQFGISHSIFELLILVARAGTDGLPLRDIAQARVVTSGGATRLVQRAVDDGLVERTASEHDGRVQLVHLTPRGEAVAVRASELHAANIERYLIDVLPAEDVEVFARSVRTLSRRAARSLPIMP